MDRLHSQVAEAKVSGPTLPLLIGAALAIGLLGFALGAGLGRSPAPSPSASELARPSGLAPITSISAVSPQLWSAYLSGSNSGWALCAVAVEISCVPIGAQPSLRFANFFNLPFRSSTADWDLLDPITVQPAHYIVAGPVTTLIDRQLAIARVTDAGVATLLNATPQTPWNGIMWADLGELGAGRYLVVTQGISLGQPDTEGRSIARGAGFASAFVVAAAGS